MARAYPLSLPIILAITMALGPFSIDAYLPAFPAIAESFAVNVSDVSLSVSVYIFMLAFGQLIGGPLSDQIGKSWIMIGGLALHIGASIGLVFAESFTLLLALRMIQAVGAGFMSVLIPAIIRDQVSGQAAAKLFSLIGLMMVIAPGIAPSVGALLLQIGSWHSIFIFLAVYGLLVMFLQAAFLLPNTHKHAAQQPKVTLISRYIEVFNTREALPFISLQAFSFTTMMLFITHASFIYQEHFAQSESAFGLLFGANIVFMFLGNLINRALLNRLKARTILFSALILQFTGTLLLLTASLGDAGLWFFVPAMMITIGSLGAVIPNNQACYMEYFGRNGGTAASLIGAFQFIASGLISAGSTLLPESLTWVILSMVATSFICVVTVSLVLKNKKTKQANAPSA